MTAPETDITPQQPEGISRRTFLKAAALMPAAALLETLPFDTQPEIDVPVASADEEPDQIASLHPQEEPLEEIERDESAEVPNKIVDIFRQIEDQTGLTPNDVTAMGMAGAFAGIIGGVVRKELNPDVRIGWVLGPKTGVVMNGMEWGGRMNILGLTDHHAYEHEFSENIIAMGIAGGLTVAAELASHSKANVDRLLSDSGPLPLYVVREALVKKLEMDELRSKRHMVDADMKTLSAKDLQSRLDTYENELFRLVTANSAMGLVIAPLATTYTAAAGVKDTLPAIGSILTKINYTRSLIDRKRSSDSMEISDELDTDLLSQAGRKAEEAINGEKGYAAMNLASTANLAGAGIIGDPPLIASLALNANKPVGELIKDHAAISLEGMSYAALGSTLSHAKWLNSIGIGKNPLEVAAQLGKFELRAVTELVKEGFVSRVQDAALMGYRKASEQLSAQLVQYGHGNNSDRGFRHLRQTLHYFEQIQPVLQFDYKALFKEKARLLQEFMPGKNKTVHRAAHEDMQHQLSVLMSVSPADRLKMLSLLDTAEMEKKISSLAQSFVTILQDDTQEVDPDVSHQIYTEAQNIFPESRKKDTIIANTSEALDDLVVKKTADEVINQAQIAQNGSELEDPIETGILGELPKMNAGEVDVLKGELQELRRSYNYTALKEQLMAMGLPAEDFIEKSIENMSEENIQERMRLLGNLGPAEVNEAFKHALDMYRAGGKNGHDHHPQLFGHQAQEVWWALMTQLPAVPSMVHLAEKGIGKLFDIQPGEPVDGAKIRTAVGMILATTAGLSGVADNVAAYLFGKKLLESLFSTAYGSRYENDKRLALYANDAALLVSVVAGSLSKIGNGPNFLCSEVKISVQDREVITDEAPIKLASSFKNQYSITQTAAVYASQLAKFEVMVGSLSGRQVFEPSGSIFQKPRA